MASPFLKWAGGKARLVPLVAAAVGPGPNRYIEPFLGGGAMFFGLRARGMSAPAILNDANGPLIETYQALRDQPEAVVAHLSALALEYAAADPADRARLYYARRASRPEDSAGRAARLIFLNKTCFNGLYRVNREGEFNVPHGDYARPNICDQPLLEEASATLRSAELTSGDFDATCAPAAAGDFVYLDPPYHPLSPTANFTSYTSTSFGLAEQARLAASVRALSGRGARFILSNSAHPAIAELYAGFVMRRVVMRRSISAAASRRNPVHELLIANFEMPAGEDLLPPLARATQPVS